MEDADPRDALSGAAFHPPGLFERPKEPQPVGPYGMLRYSRWESDDKRHYRELDQAELKARLLDVVKAEGPVLLSSAGLACNQWRRDRSKTTSPLLSLVAHELLDERAIHVRGIVGKWGTVLHAAGSPSVVVRALGPRHLQDVPPSELAELMIRTQVDLADDLRVFKATLAAYGLKELFPNVQKHLKRCLRVARAG